MSFRIHRDITEFSVPVRMQNGIVEALCVSPSIYPASDAGAVRVAETEDAFIKSLNCSSQYNSIRNMSPKVRGLIVADNGYVLWLYEEYGVVTDIRGEYVYKSFDIRVQTPSLLFQDIFVAPSSDGAAALKAAVSLDKKSAYFYVQYNSTVVYTEDIDIIEKILLIAITETQYAYRFRQDTDGCICLIDSRNFCLKVRGEYFSSREWRSCK